MDGDELHLYKTDGTNNYSCELPSDNEYGSVVLDLEVNRDLLDREFDNQIKNEDDSSIQDELNNIECSPGENC